MEERRTIEELLAEARARIRRLQPAEVAAAGDAVVIVDTRDSSDRAAEGIIPGSVLVTRNTLEWRADPASEFPCPKIASFDADLVVVCNDGYSSSLAADALRRLGHASAADMIGGYRAWRAQGLPTVPQS